jgi:hypothetical protein
MTRKLSIGGIAICVLVAVTLSVNSVPVSAAGNLAKAKLVRDADLGAIRPFQAALCVSSGLCVDPSDITVPYTTPDGETVLRLVIEYFSGACSIGLGGSTTIMVLDTTADGVEARHRFIPVVTDAAGTDTVAAQATTLYADPGTVVSFRTSVVGVSNRFCFASISGHLVVE